MTRYIALPSCQATFKQLGSIWILLSSSSEPCVLKLLITISVGVIAYSVNKYSRAIGSSLRCQKIWRAIELQHPKTFVDSLPLAQLLDLRIISKLCVKQAEERLISLSMFFPWKRLVWTSNLIQMLRHCNMTNDHPPGYVLRSRGHKWHTTW